MAAASLERNLVVEGGADVLDKSVQIV